MARRWDRYGLEMTEQDLGYRHCPKCKAVGPWGQVCGDCGTASYWVPREEDTNDGEHAKDQGVTVEVTIVDGTKKQPF